MSTGDCMEVEAGRWETGFYLTACNIDIKLDGQEKEEMPFTLVAPPAYIMQLELQLYLS